MNIVNQKPVVLTPVYSDNIKKDYDPVGLLKQTIVEPLFTPLLPGSPVSMSANNKPITEDDITDLIVRCCGEQVDIVAEQSAKTILGQTLMTYNAKTNIGVSELFVVQSATAENLPEPDSNVVYTPAADVIPTARQFLAGTCSYDKFFASLAYYARPETLGFYFVNEVAFTNFIQWFTQQMAMLGSVLTPDVNKLAADFMQLTLPGLTESLLLRNNDTDGTDPLCFPRLITNLLMQYTNVAGPAEYGVLPFNVGELINPKTIVFVNVEKHSRATARQVADEWKLINNCLQKNQRPKMISNKSLQRLTAVQRNMQKIASMAATAAANQSMQAMRAANMRFSKTRPTTVNMTRVIKKILDKMAFTNKSMNIFKSVKTSFAKPNRRDPDDYNKQGKVISTRYKPDLHLYIDTSGSISERDYEDAVKACIAMAKKLNINMYFNSFSHIMSQTTRLHLEGKSKSAIYEEFRRVPKVSGGTDYEQIWHFINKSKKRCRELSIIISDFEWTARSAYVRHPKNLYYIPCSTMNWDYITREAEHFCKSALHNEPNIRNHVLF
jgi:hypothetical protein